MKLIPHHQDDKHGRREYRSPDGAWRVVRTRRPGGNRNERPRWEVHQRHEDHADWHCHADFERRRDALVFLDTTAVTPGGESTAAAAKAAPKQRETPERPVEPHQRRTPRRPITHDIDEPAPKTSVGRCAACSCTTRSRLRRATSRRPAENASDTQRRPAT